jgi:PAS domain S-box-containing protein
MVKDISQIDRESYRLLVDSVKDYAIFMLDTDGHVMSWNKGAARIKGYTSSEIIGKHISVFYTAGEIKDNVPGNNLQKTIESGRFETEGWRVRKNGSVFWASVVFTALKNPTGELIGFGKVTRDMTRRKKADEDIQRLNDELGEQLQKSISEAVDYKHALDESAIISVTDSHGILTHVNDNFCIISKYSKEELVGRDHRIVNSGHHPDEYMHDLWATISQGAIWRNELKNKAKDGSFYWVEITIVPFIDGSGKPFQYLAISSDITARKTAEEELARINNNLEKKIRERTLELTEALNREKESNEIKSLFVSLASHEFRTPLSAILSSVSLISRYKEREQDDKRQKHIDRIKTSVGVLTNILDDFLSLEKLEHGKMEVLFTQFDLKEFIQDILGEIEGMLARKNQRIAFIYSGEQDIISDHKILGNILLNLLSNASKYSAADKEIVLNVWAAREIVTIAVKDEGIGIPEAAQKNLFNKFFRGQNALHIQGTGLGLHIVKNYVELLGGTIHFTSLENQGTTFYIELPNAEHLSEKVNSPAAGFYS